MKLFTVAGPPSSGKTSVILHLSQALSARFGVVKFDCLTSFDEERYRDAGIPVQTGFSGKFCPDHFFVNNIEGALRWGIGQGLEYLACESAGLCNRCSPHIAGVLGICVIDHLSGVHTPRKIGPMLRLADVVVVTKGDIVSQAEREVFAQSVRQVNGHAAVLPVNGITGQGAFMLAKKASEARAVNSLSGMKLRFTTPAAACAYCTGETRIGEAYQMGMMRKMDFGEGRDG
jgi:Ni2+-binding GTPase involved in maturation of urease and hydrogenase